MKIRELFDYFDIYSLYIHYVRGQINPANNNPLFSINTCD